MLSISDDGLTEFHGSALRREEILESCSLTHHDFTTKKIYTENRVILIHKNPLLVWELVDKCLIRFLYSWKLQITI